MVDMSSPRGKKTGPKPSFRTEDAVKAALALGMHTFTLSGVANQLGVSTPSLYRVIDSRDDLIDLCLAYVGKQFKLPSPELSWQDQLREYANLVWETSEQYPGFSHTLMSHFGAHVHIQKYVEQFNRQLIQSGFPGDSEKVDFAFDFIGDITVWTHQAVGNLRNDGPARQSVMKKAKARMERFHDKNVPMHWPVDESWFNRKIMDRKVEFIIQGIEAGL